MFLTSENVLSSHFCLCPESLIFFKTSDRNLLLQEEYLHLFLIEISSFQEFSGAEWLKHKRRRRDLLVKVADDIIERPRLKFHWRPLLHDLISCQLSSVYYENKLKNDPKNTLKKEEGTFHSGSSKCFTEDEEMHQYNI